MKIKELMTRDVATCRTSDSTRDAAHLMWEKDCGVLPVVDEQQRLIGMMTDRDVCMAGYTTGRKLDQILVGDVMSRNVQSCSPDDSLDAAETFMKKRHVRRLPVVDSQSHVVGILSLNDLARGAVEQDEADGGLSREEVAETLASVCEPWCSILARPASSASAATPTFRPPLVSSPAR